MSDDILDRARELLKTEKYWDLIQLFEPAVPRASDAMQIRFRLLLAQAYQKNPKWRRRAEEVLKQILDSRPTNVPALMMLGSLYAEGQLAQRASGLFKKVIELDPENREARQALDAIDPSRTTARRGFGLLRFPRCWPRGSG